MNGAVTQNIYTLLIVVHSLCRRRCLFVMNVFSNDWGWFSAEIPLTQSTRRGFDRTMIADLDETIRQLLIDTLPIKNGEIDIHFDQPRREWSARLSKPTINLFLYDIRENASLRAHQWETVQIDAARVSSKRTSFRIDCTYMITIWAADPEDEHRLMSRLMMALLQYPILPTDRYVDELRNQPFEIRTALARHDKLTNPAEVWGSLDNEIRPSVSYTATLAFDPWSAIEIPAARSVQLDTGLKASANGSTKLSASSSTKVIIGGLVRHNGVPQSGVRVALKDSGHSINTNQLGYYRLGSVNPGNYIIEYWSADGERHEKNVTIPAPDGNYDLEY
jgi:hypothetical protein